MKAPALAETVVDLPWLAPCAGSLAALVRLPPSEAWLAIRGDPGLALLWARCTDSPSPAPGFTPSSLGRPALLKKALDLLEKPAFADWSQPDLRPVYDACYLQAAVAHALAVRAGKCDPECAWIAGLLAPLGWLTACAVDPSAVAKSRMHPDFSRNPAEVQQQCWGLDHTAIARRLCRRWGLPQWLSALVGQLGLPAAIACRLGADERLFQIVQLSVGLVQQESAGLGMAIGAAPADLVDALGLDEETVAAQLSEVRAATKKSHALATPLSPAQTPFLADYLRLATERPAPSDEALMERLHDEVDRLHTVMEEQCASEAERLQEAKLRALAEFAAGAGHEINNPLAVISGQAQYLLAREDDPARCQPLHTIIAQTRRIHEILTELMQFARPKPPKKECVDLGELLTDALVLAQTHAERARVQLVRPEVPLLTPRLNVDPAQIRTAVNALLRNGIEAAPADGWVRLRVQEEEAALALIVEDNGAGPAPFVHEHLFDPFFSGKSAGRGRGLGLSTAWRLAQLNDGRLTFAGHAQGVTRFVLHLPIAAGGDESTNPPETRRIVPQPLAACA